MTKYNTNFEIGLDDMNLIEKALRTLKTTSDEEDPRDISDLLGRLHNQKNFYRPAGGVYISG